MFKSALLRLTVGYLAFIILLSAAFSGVLYRVLVSELNRDFHRRVTTLRDGPLRNLPGVEEVIALRTGQIEESKDHLRGNLFVMNLVIFLLGGGLAYLLAKRNLMPIEEAHEAQNRFTADASHELRTPLTAIRSEIEVALRDKKLTLASAKGQLRSNLEEVVKLQSLADSLLRLARHERQLEQSTTVAVRNVIGEAVDAVTKPAADRSIRIETNLEDASVRGDRWSLIELATILLDNAVKYSPSHTVITVAARKDGHDLLLTVHNQGAGIKASDLPHIFDRFYRVDQARSKERVAGYGLGLAIAKQIVEAHGGSIRAESFPGKGTRFLVRLPI